MSYVGPKFEIEMERAGDINSKVTSKFESVGINQTLHKINLELQCKMSILTPFGSVADEMTTTVILAETVIVGEVPNTFLNTNDLIKKVHTTTLTGGNVWSLIMRKKISIL